MFNFKDDFIILKVYFKKRKLVFSVSSKIFFVATTKQVGGWEGGLGGQCWGPGRIEDLGLWLRSLEQEAACTQAFRALGMKFSDCRTKNRDKEMEYDYQLKPRSTSITPVLSFS